MKEVFKLNFKVLKEVVKYHKSRLWCTSIYWFFDTLETLIYNIMFLPFIYYAVQMSFPPVKYLIIALSMFVLLIANNVYASFYNIYFKDNSNEYVRYNFQIKLFSKIKKIDICHLNKQDFYEKVNMLFMIGDKKMLEALDMIWWAISTIILLSIYLVVIISLEPLFIIIAIIGSILTYRLNSVLNKTEYKQSVEEMAIQRNLDYVHRVYSLQTYSDDMKTSNISKVMNKTYINTLIELKNLIKKFTYKIIKLRYFKTVLMFLITTSLTSAYLGYQFIVRNSITLTVGEIVIIQTNLFQLCYVLSNISSVIPQLKKNALYLKNYYEFMDYEPEIKENENGKVAQSGANSLNIKNISFSYDEDHEVLKNINLNIKAGEKIAIVGHNGAGKSTLIKLLLRLYLPQKGEIEFDNVPSDEYNLKSYRDRFGVAFQNSVIYAANVAENVMMQTTDLAADSELIWQALKKSGVSDSIEEHENELESMMTKEFDGNGIELSGGQVQKVALSRVFAKDSGVIILDEPSSSLDPISEYEMYKNMIKLSEGRTFIVISHRLSITKDVDRIVLLENGEIIECGSHKELLNKGGKYAEMWNIQAQQFA